MSFGGFGLKNVQDLGIIGGDTITFTLVFIAEPFAAEEPDGLDVYVMSGGPATSDQVVIDALTARGYDAVLGAQPHEWTGLQADLADFDVVVILNNYNWDEGSMPATGETDLLNYVENGGGLVTGEWLIWNIESGGRHTGLEPMMAASLVDFNSAEDTSYTQLATDDVINDGLPESFNFDLNDIDNGSESFLRPKPGATVFYASSNSGHAGLVGWNFGEGRVLNFSTLLSDVELANSDYERLFGNAVERAGILAPFAIHGVGPPRIDFFGPRAQPDSFEVFFVDLPDINPLPGGAPILTQGIAAHNRTGPIEPFTSSCLPAGTGSVAYLRLVSPRFGVAPYAMTSTDHAGFQSLAAFGPEQLSFDFTSGNMLIDNIIDRHDLDVAGNAPMSLNDPLFDVLDNVVYFIEEGTERRMEKRAYPDGSWTLIDNAGTPENGADDDTIAEGSVVYITLFLDYSGGPSTGRGLVRVDEGSAFFDELTGNFGTDLLYLDIESLQSPVVNDEPMTPLPQPHWVCVDPTGYAVFEASVSVTPSDPVNDRVRDFIVGAPLAEPGGLEAAGSAYLYSGIDGALIHQVNGESEGDRFGWSVAMLGDVNGDGVSDFIVGAPFGDSEDFRDAGKAYVYSGADGRLIYEKSGFQIDGNFGWSVSDAGDVDQDGTSDFLVGAYRMTYRGLGLAGAVYAYSGADGSLINSVLGAETLNAQFGYSVSGAGDLDGDGRADFIAGAPFTHAGGVNNAGRAYVYSAGAPNSYIERAARRSSNDMVFP